MILSKLRAVVAEPALAAYRARAKLSPRSILDRHTALSKRTGIDRVYLLLSFDCDTAEDGKVVVDLHAKLTAMGATPMYAVPGATIEEQPEPYQHLASSGAPFLNHGYLPHTRFDDTTGTYVSRTFYNEMPRESVVEDIDKGHDAIVATLNLVPKGFRTPHFGTFRRPEQLRFLHRELKERGYRYSSSTLPFFGARYGPMTKRLGMWEFPVTGMASAPLQILDSWSCFAAPNRSYSPTDYLREAKEIARLFAANGVGVINLYADPSHVHGSEEFSTAVRTWLDIATPITFDDLIERTGTEHGPTE